MISFALAQGAHQVALLHPITRICTKYVAPSQMNHAPDLLQIFKHKKAISSDCHISQVSGITPMPHQLCMYKIRTRQLLNDVGLFTVKEHQHKTSHGLEVAVVHALQTLTGNTTEIDRLLTQTPLESFNPMVHILKLAFNLHTAHCCIVSNHGHPHNAIHTIGTIHAISCGPRHP